LESKHLEDLLKGSIVSNVSAIQRYSFQQNNIEFGYNNYFKEILGE